MSFRRPESFRDAAANSESARAAYLDCVMLKPAAPGQANRVLLSFGHQSDGAIENLELSLQDARRLVLRLAMLLKPRRHPRSFRPMTTNVLTRYSVERAQARVRNDAKGVLNEILQNLPDLGCLLTGELRRIRAALDRPLAKREKELFMRRVERFVILVADTACKNS